MRDLGFEWFGAQWSTYWGRRELGIVIDNGTAARVASDERSLRQMHTQWQEAVRVFPAEASLMLMGTPDLGSSFPRAESDGVPRPPDPRVGRYAAGNAAITGLSDESGAYEPFVDTSSPAWRAGRSLRRGQHGFTLSLLSLAMVWLPVFSIPVALLSLLWAMPAYRLVRGRIALRHRWRFTVAPVIAGLAVALSILVLVIPHPSSPSFVPREDTVMAGSTADSAPASFTRTVITRLRQHWPSAVVVAQFEESDPDNPTVIRIRVADDVYLDAFPGETSWTMQPTSGRGEMTLTEAESRPYGIGVRTDDGPVEVADRIYEEVRYWWAKLHPTAPDELEA